MGWADAIVMRRALSTVQACCGHTLRSKRLNICGEGACPPFACEAGVNPANAVCQESAGGRFATQTGQAPSPQSL